MGRALSNISLVSGTEWLGFWFIILVIGRTNTGSLFLASAFEDHYEKIKSSAAELIVKLSLAIETTKSPNGPLCNMNKSKVEYYKNVCSRPDPNLAAILSLFEDLLIFHSAVFHKQIWWSFEKKRKWEGWMYKIIKNIPIILPHVLGNAWNFPEVHLQKHFPSNIQEYSAPLNFDCTNGEHAL